MSRNREISPDFRTWEAVVDCAPMTRLLFLDLRSVADDPGVQPLRPRTIDGDAVRGMIDKPAARGLERRHGVDGWDRLRRVGQRARRRFPGISEMDQGLARSAPAVDTIANHSNPPPTSEAEAIADHSNPPSTSRAEAIANHSNPPSTCVKEDGQAAIALASPRGPQTAPRMTGALNSPHVAPTRPARRRGNRPDTGDQIEAGPCGPAFSLSDWPVSVQRLSGGLPLAGAGILAPKLIGTPSRRMMAYCCSIDSRLFHAQ
jgi:hypothetical protein